ncbi:hypothetical protein [Pseudomonas syringae]|uniref:hypothetical protein n=1 Tax=Pseudomonas syringae TaxID=317 RepID=UPI001F41E329|nr:hypothetical protein [Pseudomonas syringae]MBL3831535.1 hypothetical protein [Pseudomonas syringae pv. theae]MBL3833155.1 hypothetical protein [Pseudomonas syringae pv. theae]GKQ45088.1 hypothetical protein PSTH2693_08050 [Pseudomonas syringae pv. theae]
MKKSKLVFGFIAAILSVSLIHAIADEAENKLRALTPTLNFSIEENKAKQEIFLKHVNSMVGEPVYQNDETGVTVYAAPEPEPITVDN